MASTTAVIPFSATFPWTEQVVSLSGTRYTIGLRFNGRMQRWICDVGDASGTPIVSGLPLMLNREMLGQYPARSLPPGFMFCIDLSGQALEPGLSSFLKTHRFVYYVPG